MKLGLQNLPLVRMGLWRSRHHKTALGNILKNNRGKVINKILIISIRVIRKRVNLKKNKVNIKKCGKRVKKIGIPINNKSMTKKEMIKSLLPNNKTSDKTTSNKSMQNIRKSGTTIRMRKLNNVVMNMSRDFTRDPIIKGLTRRILTLLEIPK